MNHIPLLTAIKEKPLIVIIFALIIFFITPLIQSFNTTLAFQIWFRDLIEKPVNSILYLSFSTLFGSFIALYLFSRNKCIECKTENNFKKASIGFSGSFVGFFIGVCPACFSLIGFMIPLGTSIFLTTYAPLFILISILIILFSIYKLGGFKKLEIIS